MIMDSKFQSIALRFSDRLQKRARELSDAKEQGIAASIPRQLSEDVVQGIVTLETVDPPEVDSEDLRNLLERSEELAALSGLFAPQDLVPEDVDAELRNRVLSALSIECFVQTQGGPMRWFMLADARTTVLERMKKNGRLSPALLPNLPATDAFGDVLRELLRDGTKVSLNRSQPELLQLSRALDALMPTAPGPLPDVNEIRGAIARASFLSDFDGLVSHGFFGRAAELRRLREFIEKPLPPTASPDEFGALCLTGPGGSGKSTLLAKLLREVFDARRTFVVVLDFDRPGVDPGDSEWLEFEISRQIGYQAPELQPTMQQQRRDVRSERRTGSGVSGDLTSSKRSGRPVINTLAHYLTTHAERRQELLLVLDTIEHVVERNVTTTLVSWLYELSSALFPVRLKVIASGRVYESGLNALGSLGTTPPLEIGPLKPKEAAALLISLEVPGDRAASIAASDVIPLRPLELKLLARLLKEQPDTDIARIERELREGGPAAAALFSGIVYRRVLQRLKGTKAQELAYPGLILRFITPEVIQNVLVPALKLPPATDVEARTTLDELAAHEWLVRRDSTGAIWHRRDLRSSTLPAMIAEERKAEKEKQHVDRARAIHLEAIRYFSGATDNASQAEALYHTLMLTDTPTSAGSITVDEIRPLASYIQDDASDWPLAAQTLFKYATNKVVPIQDLPLLPLEQRADAYQKTGARLMRVRDLGQAWTLFSARDMLLETSSYEAMDVLTSSWEIEAAFGTANWEALARIERPRSETEMLIFVRAMTGIHSGPPAAVDKLFPRSIFRRSTGGTLNSTLDLELRRLAVGIVLEEETRDVAYKAGALEDVFLSDRVISPALQRRWYLARRSAGFSESTAFTMTPEFFCLRSTWVASFRSPSSHVDIEGAALDLSRKIGRVLIDGAGTARQLLNEIDALGGSPRRSNRAPGVINAPRVHVAAGAPVQSVATILRGPTPELRDPARFALLDAFPGPDGAEQLAQILQSRLNISISALVSGAFVREMQKDPERALEPYIELVDRSWQLGELLEAAAQRALCNARLRAVLNACLRWNRAVDNALGREEPDEQSGSLQTQQE